MDPVPIGLVGHPVKESFQNRSVSGRGGHVRTPPGREQDKRVVDQPSLARSWGSGVERMELAGHEARAPKASVNLVRQLLFDASDIILVENLGGQTGDFTRLIRMEKATQCHGDMTGIPV